MSAITITGILRMETFPFRIRQESVDWCIPANIEAVTKYHVPNSMVTQGYLVTRFGDMSQIGFESIKDRVLNVDEHFSWATITYFRESDFEQSFEKFVSFVQKHVDESKPPMISIPIGEKSWHMLTVVGYDDTYFLVYDPDPRVITSHQLLQKEALRIALCSRKNLQDAATDSLVLSTKVT